MPDGEGSERLRMPRIPALTLLLALALGGSAGAETTSPSRSDPSPVETLALGPEDAPGDLVEIPVPPATRPGLRLRSEASAALLAMVEAARSEGVQLRVVSAYRSYAYQESLHARAVRRHGEDQGWVAAPGRSEHQLGTTVDLADGALEHVLEASFAETVEAVWLERNAARYGFTQSYTEANAPRTGIRPEPWHYRHRPLAEETPTP